MTIPKNETARDIIMATIWNRFSQHGDGPSLGELCRVLDCKSKNTVRYYLNILERDGLILCDPGVPRGIRPVGGLHGVDDTQPSNAQAVLDELRSILLNELTWDLGKWKKRTNHPEEIPNLLREVLKQKREETMSLQESLDELAY